MLTVANIPEFYAHAIAIEREAVNRYREFAQWMSDLGMDHVAELFEKLEQMEKQHLRLLEKDAAHFPLPELSPWQYAWLFTSLPGPLETAFPLMPQNTHDALKLALAAERRAVNFFRGVAETARDPGVRILAAKMVEDERHHIDDIERLLKREHDPVIDWETVYGEGGLHRHASWA